jgi:hypothetical protein
MENLVCKCIIWEWMPQIHPGIATNRDGRLMVTDGKQTIILPAPATFIWEDAQARDTIRKLS